MPNIKVTIGGGIFVSILCSLLYLSNLQNISYLMRSQKILKSSSLYFFMSIWWFKNYPQYLPKALLIVHIFNHG